MDVKSTDMRTPRQLVSDLLTQNPDAKVSAEELAELNRALDGVTRPSNASVHRALRNYLVNELKLNQETVAAQLKAIALAEMRAWLDQQVTYLTGTPKVTAWLSGIVTDVVRSMLKEHVERRMRYAKINVVVD